MTATLLLPRNTRETEGKLPNFSFFTFARKGGLFHHHHVIRNSVAARQNGSGILRTVNPSSAQETVALVKNAGLTGGNARERCRKPDVRRTVRMTIKHRWQRIMHGAQSHRYGSPCSRGSLTLSQPVDLSQRETVPQKGRMGPNNHALRSRFQMDHI